MQPSKNDPVSSAICNCCWSKLSNFHDFYQDVERAQQHLNVEIIVKTEDNLQFGNITIEEVEFSNKREINESTQELYEAPFSIPPLEDFEENNEDLMNFESQPNLQYQSDDTNEQENDDNYEDTDSKVENEINANNEIKLEVSTTVNKKKTTRCRKFTRVGKYSKNDDLLESNHKTTSTLTYKGRGRPRKGQVVPLKNKTKNKCDNNESEPASELIPPVSQNLKIKVKSKNYKEECESADITSKEVSQNVNRTIAEYMQLKCDICGLELETFALLRNHMKSVHEVHPYVKCCEKKFTKRAWLYDHIKFHLNPDIYK